MTAIKNLFVNVIEPQLENFGKFKILKWGFNIIEILTSSQVFGTIYDKLRFRVGDKTYCFAYGSVSRCNYGVQMSLIGLLIGLYTMSLEIFSNYTVIPLIMKWGELELCAFKIGLWLITGKTLDRWFIKKFDSKHKKGNGHYIDRMNKLRRMNKMIGDDVRNVRKMWRYTLFILLSSFVIIILERREKRKKIDEKLNN
jgi:hypothetical protein